MHINIFEARSYKTIRCPFRTNFGSRCIRQTANHFSDNHISLTKLLYACLHSLLVSFFSKYSLKRSWSLPVYFAFLNALFFCLDKRWTFLVIQGWLKPVVLNFDGTWQAMTEQMNSLKDSHRVFGCCADLVCFCIFLKQYFPARWYSSSSPGFSLDEDTIMVADTWYRVTSLN